MKIVSAILFPLATGFAFLFLLLAWIVALGGDLSIQLAGTAVVLVVVIAVGCWYRVAKRKQQADGPVRSSCRLTERRSRLLGWITRVRLPSRIFFPEPIIGVAYPIEEECTNP